MEPTSDHAAKLESLRVMMAALGITPEELLSTPGVPRITFGAFVAGSVLPGLPTGSRTAWSTSIATAREGLPLLCACLCPRCLNSFRGDSQWTPCACVVAGLCTCAAHHLSAGPVHAESCLEHCLGFEDVEFAAITLSQLEQLSHWAQLRAMKRTAARNSVRAAHGQAPFRYDGHAAVESLRSFLSKAYKLARGDNKTGVNYNLALDMRRFPRPKVQKRSYSDDKLEELWSALFTSGGDDVELDALLVSFLLETGARRSAPIKTRVGDMLISEMKVRLGEKNDKIDEQPVSPALMLAILRHSVERGEVVLKAPTGWDSSTFTLEDVISREVILRPDAPVFYYRDKRNVKQSDGSIELKPHPLTKRRFDSLWGRLRRELPWLEEIHGRPHDLRKTVGTLVERLYGHATAQAFLRHGNDNVTGIYTAAGEDEVKIAHEWLTGGRDDEDWR